MVEIKDLVGLSKPAEKLIDVIAKGVGRICEPALIRRNAKAEADAAIIRAEADAKVSDIAYRAKVRLETKELRRQGTIEAIINQAGKLLPDQVSSDPVDEGWAINFFEACQDVSDEQMRGLWARILAGEVTQSNSFSRRTLRVLKDLSRTDADNFEGLLSYLWWFQTSNGKMAKLIVPSVSSIKDLSLSDITELEAYGLISHRSLSGLLWQTKSKIL